MMFRHLPVRKKGKVEILCLKKKDSVWEHALEFCQILWIKGTLSEVRLGVKKIMFRYISTREKLRVIILCVKEDRKVWETCSWIFSDFFDTLYASKSKLCVKKLHFYHVFQREKLWVKILWMKMEEKVEKPLLTFFQIFGARKIFQKVRLSLV